MSHVALLVPLNRALPENSKRPRWKAGVLQPKMTKSLRKVKIVFKRKCFEAARIGCTLPIAKPRRVVLPHGYIDIYKRQHLSQYQPLVNNAMTLYVADMNYATIDLRVEAEALLFEAFKHDSYKEGIQDMLGLKKKQFPTRSGRQPSRQAVHVDTRTWLIYETICKDDRTTMVAAAIVQYRLGMNIEYIGSDSNAGGKAHLLIEAAVELCRSTRCGVLYSAADLTQDGHAWAGRAKHSLKAHLLWGFQEVCDKDIMKERMKLYSRSSAIKILFKDVAKV